MIGIKNFLKPTILKAKPQGYFAGFILNSRSKAEILYFASPVITFSDYDLSEGEVNRKPRRRASRNSFILKKNQYLVILSLMLILSSCSKDQNTIQKNELELIASFKINVAEPSGLAINNSGTILYTVSDNTNKIYKLSTTGNSLQTFNYIGNDLEGVTVFTDNKLLVAEERTKEVVEFDMSSNSFVKHKINYENDSENSGIEGIAYNTNDGTIFILNEKDPGLLIRLRTNFTIISTNELNFASDYSGIFHDSSLNKLWIVSDQNKTINKCTLTGELIESYQTTITKVEGIVVTNEKIYVVSDAEEKLYIYKKPID